MSWKAVERNKPEVSGGVLLSITTQKLRNGRMLRLLRIKLENAVMREAGLKPGGSVDLLRGEGEDRGKIRLRPSGEGEGFRIIDHHSRKHPSGQIILNASLLGVEGPAGLPPTRTNFRIDAGFVEIDLPPGLHPDDSPVEPGRRLSLRSAYPRVPRATAGGGTTGAMPRTASCGTTVYRICSGRRT